MEGFTIVDAVVAAVIILSAILAYSRGIVREIMAIAGWVAAAILAFMFAAQAEPLIKQIPMVGDFLGNSCEISRLAAFAAVFAVALLVISFFTPLLSLLVKRASLGGIDRVLGLIFGVARGVLLVVVAFLLYQTVVPDNSVPEVANSRSVEVFAQLTDQLKNQDSNEALEWVTGKYEELVGECAAPAAPAEPVTPTAPEASEAPASN